MPRFPSASKANSHCPSPGTFVEHIATDGERTAHPGLAYRFSRDIDAHGGDLSCGQLCDEPTGPAADVDGRAGARLDEQLLVDPVGC